MASKCSLADKIAPRTNFSLSNESKLMNIDIQHSLHHAPMRAFQIFAIAICCMISFIDGFDVLAVAFVAPSITSDWQISPKQLGLLFSSGLAGMVIGALFISPLADRLGRRFLLLTCLVILSLGMFASTVAINWEQMLASRIFTGLGMGAILPAINTVVAEYSSNKYRSMAISIMAASYTVGATIGGIISILLINAWGWHSVFLFGATLSALLIPVVMFQLPESLDFLLARRRPDALKKINQLMGKLNLPELDQLPKLKENQNVKKENTFGQLFSPTIARSTLLLCLSYFMLMCTFYFLANWTPKILQSLGYSKDISITGSVIMNSCGIAGGLILGWLTKRFRVQLVTAVMLLLGFGMVVYFGFSANILSLLMVIIGVIGFAIYGSMAGLYATAPIIFPPEVRATGTGLVLGIGRLGATAGPYLAGVLIEAQWAREYYFSALALPLLLAAICIWLIKAKN